MLFYSGALLYWTSITLQRRDRVTVTRKCAYWGAPTISNTKDLMCVIEDVDFTTLKKKLKALNPNFVQKPSSKSIKEIEETIEVLMSQMALKEDEKHVHYKFLFNKQDKKGVFLTMVDPYSDYFIPKFELLKADLGSIFDNSLINLSLKELQEIAWEFDIELSSEIIKLIEEMTRDQALCTYWFKFRCGRISGTTLYSVLHFKSLFSSPSLIKQICYKVKTKTKQLALLWGTENEANAASAFLVCIKKQHIQVKIIKCGLCIHPQLTMICATPDNIVECVCCGKKIVEYKCPFIERHSSIDKYATSNTSCLKRNDNNELKLDTRHKYFIQVQAQLACSGLKKAFFWYGH
jgi:hypothetical protein